MFDLIRFLHREAVGPKLLIVVLSLITGMSRAAILATINIAAAAAVTVGTGQIHLHLPVFLLFLSIYLYTSYFTAERTVSMTQGLVNRLRLRMCHKILRTQLRFVEEKRRPVLLSSVIGDIEQISSSVMSMLGAFQGGVLLLFALLYIGWLSPFGLVVTLAAIGAGVATHLRQATTIMHNQELARRTWVTFHGALEGLIDGFKELKLNNRKRDDYTGELARVADTHRELIVRTTKITLKSELTSQTYMFALIAVMLFALPQMVAHDTTLVFQFVTAVLFLMGPLELVVSSIPSFTRAKVSWENVRAIEADIDAALSERPGVAPPASAPEFQRLVLRDIGFGYPSEAGEPSF